jgi:hypothetical protein
MVAGDPLYDIGKVFLQGTKGDLMKQEALMEGYCMPLNDISFEKPTDFEGRVHLYEVYHALATWVFHETKGNRRYLKNIVDWIDRLMCQE